MKHFDKIICFIILLIGTVSITFSEEKNVVIYVAPSTWQESPPISTNDPVPPLGDGEEKFIGDKMDDKTIKKLVDGFVDRVEATYTKKYTTPEGFLEYLKKTPQLRSTFWLALSPYYDDIKKAMEVLNDLRQSDAQAVERFYHLAIAFAVVWDSPDAIQSSRYACIWEMPPNQFEPLPNLLANFKYFTDPKNLALFNISPDKLTWPTLVHIVDMDLTAKDIEWGLKSYQNKRQFIKTIYDSIKYDYGKAGGATPKLGNDNYNLQNLLKYGGICGDQAHFASRLAKLFGTPSMKVAGTGRYGEGHAWLGYMNMKNNQWEIDFTGRYFFDFYYTGEIFDPQTRTKILDSEIAMLYEGINSDYNKYINSLTLTRIAQGLITDKPKVSINLTINALQQNIFCTPAWLTLMKHVEKGQLKPSQGIFWFNQMTTSLRKYPDAIMSCLGNFMGCIPKDDYPKRDANYQAVTQIFKSVKRPDLLIRLAIIQGEELCARGQADKALNIYLDNAVANAGEGNLILPLLERAMELSRKLNKVQETIAFYEKVIQRMPHFRGNKISKSYRESAQLLVYLYNDVAMSDKANKLSKMAQLGEVTQIACGIDETHKKKPEKTIAELTEAIQLTSTSTAAHNERGQAYRLKGEMDKALEDFNEALKLNPKSDEVYHNRADAYSQTGDIEKALTDYNEAIKLNLKNAVAYHNRGLAYYNKGEFDKAIADYNEAIKLNPKYELAYLNRGIAYGSKGEIDRALADYNETIKLNPKYDEAYFNRGSLYNAKRQINQAIADFSEVIRLNPKHYHAYINRGGVYSNIGAFDQAIADYNEAIRLNPPYDRAYNNRGFTYANKGEIDKALADYNEAIRLNPKCAPAYTNRGLAYSHKGEIDKAIEDYNEAIKLDPKYDTAYNNRGLAYHDKREFDQAIKDFNEAIRLNPKNDSAYWNRGQAYAAKGEIDKGIADWEYLLKLFPNHPRAFQVRREINYWKQKLQEQNK